MVISHNSVHMDPAKVAGVSEWPTPTNKKEVQSFLGFVNFYQRFIEGFSHIARPLFDLTKADSIFKWSDKEKLAFDTIRNWITSAPILTLPDNIEWKRTAWTSLPELYFLNIIWRMINGTLSPSYLNPYPQLKGIMRYTTKRCWLLSEPWKNGGTF